jgi:hypothetical protein
MKKLLIFQGGECRWYLGNLRHRDDDKPSYFSPSGYRSWWVMNLNHRDDDLPAIIYTSGVKEYYKHGIRYDYKHL